MLSSGVQAPAFSLEGQNGKRVSLVTFLGGPVIIFFFPKSGSPVCTKEACLFRDRVPISDAASAQVIGISRDLPAAQSRFAAENCLAYPILSDPDGHTAKDYLVPKVLGLMPARVTYVVDGKGLIAAAFRNNLNPGAHLTFAISTLEEINRRLR